MTKIDENILAARNLLTEMVERCYELEDENKKLKEEIEKLRVLKHRDTILSIMYDLVRSKEVTDERKIRIIRKVIDVESWAAWTYKRKDEDVENFFKRIFKPYL